MKSLSDAFSGFIVIVLLVGAIIGLAFLLALLGTMVGLFVGWVIHISPLRIFVEKGFEVFGFNVQGLLPHIGAALGFVTGFIKGIFTLKRNEKE